MFELFFVFLRELWERDTTIYILDDSIKEFCNFLSWSWIFFVLEETILFMFVFRFRHYLRLRFIFRLRFVFRLRFWIFNLLTIMEMFVSSFSINRPHHINIRVLSAAMSDFISNDMRGCSGPMGFKSSTVSINNVPIFIIKWILWFLFLINLALIPIFKAFLSLFISWWLFNLIIILCWFCVFLFDNCVLWVLRLIILVDLDWLSI